MLRTLLVLLCLTQTVISGCSSSSVGAGEEGVMIYQPYVFGHGGVDPEPIRTGQVWTAWTTRVERYDIKPVKYKENFIDLTAEDNVAIDFDVYLTLEIQEGQSPVLHEKSGRQWYENKIKDTFRAFVRNEARTKTSIELRTNENVINQTQDTIKQLMMDYIRSIELPVNVVKTNIGKVVPPEEVLAEAAQTAAQKQRKQTQEQRKLAEDARAEAEMSAALADKAYSDKFKMTTAQFLKNKELDIMSKVAEKGVVTLILGGSSVVPVTDITNGLPKG